MEGGSFFSAKRRSFTLKMFSSNPKAAPLVSNGHSVFTEEDGLVCQEFGEASIARDYPAIQRLLDDEVLFYNHHDDGPSARGREDVTAQIVQFRDSFADYHPTLSAVEAGEDGAVVHTYIFKRRLTKVIYREELVVRDGKVTQITHCRTN